MCVVLLANVSGGQFKHARQSVHDLGIWLQWLHYKPHATARTRIRIRDTLT